MSDPEWTIVLDKMYEELQTIEDTSRTTLFHVDPDSDDLREMAEKTGIDEEKLKGIYRSLIETGLVSGGAIFGENSERVHTYGLTKKGLEVAHDRSVNEQQRDVTKRTGGYTLILVLAVAIQGLAVSQTLPSYQSVGVGLLVLFIVGIASIEFLEFVRN